MRAAELNPDTNIVINVIETMNLWVIPNLVRADDAGNIGDWYDWSNNQFVPVYDPRHPAYVAIKGQ